MRYLDSSVLAKPFLEESGADTVRRWLAEPGCVTSRLSLVEVASAIRRKVRERALSAEAAGKQLDDLDQMAQSLDLNDLTQAVVERSWAVLARHPLRAGDAVQLSSALVLRDSARANFWFACTDDRLAAAAAAEGLVVERP